MAPVSKYPRSALHAMRSFTTSSGGLTAQRLQVAVLSLCVVPAVQKGRRLSRHMLYVVGVSEVLA